MVWKLCFNWYYNTCCCCCIRRWSARAAIRAPTEAALKITIVCTSSHFINWSEDDNKLSKQVKTGFKLLNGINTDQKWLNRLKLTTS